VSEPSIISLQAKDPYLRWAVSRLLVWQRDDLEFMDCDLTRRFCKRLNEDPTELVGRFFVWDLPILGSRGLYYYEEDFIKCVLPVARKLPALIVVTRGDEPLKRIMVLCDTDVRAEYTRGGIAFVVRELNLVSEPRRYVVPIPVRRKKRRRDKVG